MTINLDTTVEITLRDLFAIRAAAVTPAPFPATGTALSAEELREFGLAPQREKHVAVNLADLRHAQKYDVVEQFLADLDRQADVVDRVSLATDEFIRTGVTTAPKATTKPAPKVAAEKSAPVEPEPVAEPAPEPVLAPEPAPAAPVQYEVDDDVAFV